MNFLETLIKKKNWLLKIHILEETMDPPIYNYTLWILHPLLIIFSIYLEFDHTQ